MKARELFQAGDRLGDYEIVRRLRAGGMATLFLGRRHGAAGVSRPIVIKVIHPHLAEDEVIVKMFIDEARISSHISHSNVVYVENFGEHDGVYFMAMEYVDGYSLDQLLKTLHQRSRKCAIDVAVHIALEAAAGLHAAHETCDEAGNPLNIVHRDVSPSNVLITRDGRVKVIDFGIAKARGRLVGTRSGAKIKGKLRYMAPEQAWGREIDRRADVYALGVTLWELLTCRPLFRGDDDFAIIDLVRNPVVPSPREYTPDIPIALESVVMRALAKDAGNRPQTALELRRELMRAMPSAVTVPTEAIGQLVMLVRETVGPLVDASEDKATTPLHKSTPPAGSAVGEVMPEAPLTTGSASAGQVNTYVPPRSKRWLIATAAAFACGVGLTALAVRSPEQAPPTTNVLLPTATVTPVDAALAPVPATAPAELPTAPPIATTVTPAKSTAKPTRKRASSAKPAKREGVTTVNDGTVLATEPKPGKRKPKTEVRVEDGTVLSR